LILNAPPDSSLRLGIYGGWGEGKTSVLHLMKLQLESAGHLCVWLTPWLFESREEVASALLSAIAEKLEINIRHLSAAQTAAAKTERIRHAAASSDIKYRLAEAIFGPALSRFVKDQVQENVQSVMALIEEKLAGRKLIVFVDDVDRVNPSQVPGLLLMLREALGQPNYFYVLALAPDVVERGLKAVNEAWGEPRQFLEKIVELPCHLPKPSPQQRAIYLKEMLSRSGVPRAEVSVLQSISSLLPENPRRLKLFIRYISSLQSLLARFGDDELDRRAFYLLQMLRVEFSDETRAIGGNDKVLRDLEFGRLRDLHARVAGVGRDDKEKKERPEAALITEDHPDRDRFMQLCAALREGGSTSWRGSGLRNILSVTEEPPFFTFRELEQVTEEWGVAGVGSRSKVLTDAITVGGHPQRERVAALFAGLLQVRQARLDAAASADLEEEVRSFTAGASSVLDAIGELSIGLQGFQSGNLDSDNWIALFRHAASWAHFGRLEYYVQIRSEERTILRETFSALPAGGKVSTAGPLSSWDSDSGPGIPPAEDFITLWRELRDSAQDTAGELLLGEFRRANGLGAFWSERSPHPGKDFLFDPDARFHRQERFRRAMTELAGEARNNIEVQRNFVTYMQQLCHGAFKGGSFPLDGCRKLLKDEGLLRVIWRGATARPLNPRTAGSLREYRNALLKWSVPGEVIPLPDWWQALEASGFWKDRQLDGAAGAGEAGEGEPS